MTHTRSRSQPPLQEDSSSKPRNPKREQPTTRTHKEKKGRHDQQQPTDEKH
jgi:hypothetical protein